MASYVEHIQYVCSDLEEMAAFYCTIFQWKVRGRGRELGSRLNYDWIHVGDDESYVAFRTPYNGAKYEKAMRTEKDHVGIVVDDIDQVILRLDALKVEHVRKGTHPYRDRIYVVDPDKNEVEIICYRSNDPRQRNDYLIDAS